MSKLSGFTPEFIEWLVMNIRSRMAKKGYSVGSLPQFKHGYLSACLTNSDYQNACQIEPFISIACMSDNVHDMDNWLDSLPTIIPMPVKKSEPIPEGEMFT